MLVIPRSSEREIFIPSLPSATDESSFGVARSIKPESWFGGVLHLGCLIYKTFEYQLNCFFFQISIELHLPILQTSLDISKDIQ